MRQPPTIAIETCALCRKSDDLRQSHIVPRFVWDWLKESSATGYFRSGISPNKREQDGLKIRLLCGDCEQLLGTWEKAAAERVFLPIHDTNNEVLDYESWFGKFCASVCWRVLVTQHLWGGLSHLSGNQVALAEEALDTWRAFLLGERNNLNPFEQNVIRLEPIASTTVPGTPPNMNRYILRSVDTDVVNGSRSAFVYAKLCRLLVVGFIQMPEPWIGTHVNCGDGTIRPTDCRVPEAFGEYMTGRAIRIAELQAEISDRQQAKLDAIVASEPDKVAQSQSFEAMIEDVRLFGKDAFRKNAGED